MFASIFKKLLKSLFPLVPFVSLRVMILRLCGYKIGRNVYIPCSFRVSDIAAHRKNIIIGDRVSIGPNVLIITDSSPNNSKLIKLFPMVSKGVVIENDVWLGANVIILPGVKIGKCSVLGSGAVVNRDIPPFSLAVGIPAIVKKKLMKMSFNLIPRFYYTFSAYRYLSSFIVKTARDDKTNFIAEALSDNRVFFFNYARTGLRFLLSSISSKSLRVGVQVYTCHTIFQAIKRSGHEIVFLDINNNFGIDIVDLKSKNDQIDVLIITHTFGIPDDYNILRKIVGRKIIIEDCAHSYLSKYYGKYTGTLADAAIFSYGFGKLPPIGQGGVVLINKTANISGFSELYEQLSHESFFSELKHLIKKVLFSILLRKPIYGLLAYRIGKKLDSKFDFTNKYSFKESKGYKADKKFFLKNFKLFEKLVRSNISKFKSLKKVTLNSIFLNKSKNLAPNYYVVPIVTETQESFLEYLLDNQIEAGKHFQNSITWAKDYGYIDNECRNAEDIANKVITIPLHYGVSSKNLKRITRVLNEYIQK